MAAPEKDRWDKAAVILHPIGGLLAAMAVAGLGFFGSQFLEKRQAEETRARFFSELISKREEADSALRKDMFMSIIQSFLNPESTSVEDRIVKLELLAYNFHESSTSSRSSPSSTPRSPGRPRPGSVNRRSASKRSRRRSPGRKWSCWRESARHSSERWTSRA
jgi:hypothetical protein